VFEGEFKDGKLNGKGKRIMSRGPLVGCDLMLCSFSGKKTMKNGEWYEGYFKENKLNGRCK